MNDLKILTADYRVDYSDLSTHRYGSRTYEWEYSQNSQKKRRKWARQKGKKLGQKKSNLDKKQGSDLDKIFLSIISDQSIKYWLICIRSKTTWKIK